jgi:hypothetical protein
VLALANVHLDLADRVRQPSTQAPLYARGRSGSTQELSSFADALQSTKELLVASQVVKVLFSAEQIASGDRDDHSSVQVGQK